MEKGGENMAKSKILNVLILSLVMAFMIVTPSLSSEKKKTKADEKVRKAVYHCDFGDANRFDSLLRNAYNLVNHYTENNIPYDVRVVANGACVQFLLKDKSGTQFAEKKIDEKVQKSIDERMSSLVDGYGVKFEQCNITLKRTNIPKEKLKPFCTITESGQVRVVELHDEGFAYIKVE
jgi:intracellular sulfur oxidation DsrE/DsrF family protein